MNVFDYIEKELDRIEVGYTSYDGTKITLTMDEVRELVQNLRKKYQADEDVIYRQDAIDAARDWYNGLICGSFRGLEKRLKSLPSAQLDVPDTNAGDMISRSAAIETQEKIIADHPLDGYEDGLLLINALNDLPSIQPDQQTIAGQKSDLIYRETARRIIDSPRSKSQMLTVLRCTPSAQPEPQWIPCSERLPSKEEQKEWIDKNLDGIGYLYPCLVTRYSRINPDRTKNNPYVAKHYFDGEDFVNNGEEVCTEYIIAWMPLPEPYAERRKENG